MAERLLVCDTDALATTVWLRRYCGPHVVRPRPQNARTSANLCCHSAGAPPNYLDKGLPVRTWRLRGLYAKIRGPYQDKSDRVVEPPGGRSQACPELDRLIDGRPPPALTILTTPDFPFVQVSPTRKHTHTHTHTHCRAAVTAPGHKRCCHVSGPL